MIAFFNYIARASKPSTSDTSGNTALHNLTFSTVSDNEKALQLLREGAIVNARNIDGETPLHLWAQRGATHALALLLEFGADVNAQNIYGEMPLHYVMYNAHTNVEKHNAAVRLLLSAGADETISHKGNLIPIQLTNEKVIKDSFAQYRAIRKIP